MAKTAKERMQLYRQKMKAADKELAKANDRRRKAKERSSQSPAQIKMENEAKRKRMSKLRRDRAALQMHQSASNNDEPYASKMALMKAIQRVKKKLPKNETKKSIVLQKLSYEFNILPKPKRSINANRAFPNSTIKLIVNFYERI